MTPISNRYLDAANNVWKQKDHPDTPHGQQTPNAQTGVAAVKNPTTPTSAINVTWTPSNSTGVTETRVFRSLSATGAFTRVATVAGNTATSYTDTGLNPGSTYYYKLTAYNATLNLSSSFTSAVSAATDNPIVAGAPNTPTGLSAAKTVGAPTTDIAASWTASAVDGSHAAATSYDVYGDGTFVRNVTTTSITFTWPTAGDTVTVQVRGVNSSGNSSLTTGVNVVLDTPVAPTGEYDMIMGVSRSNNYNYTYNPAHGGIPDQFRAVRCYDSTIGALTDVMTNFTGAEVIGLTDSAWHISNAESFFAGLFESFYYNADGSARTGRRDPINGIALHVAQGNEYGDHVKPDGAALAAGDIHLTDFITCYQGLRAASRTVNPGTSVRRYPRVEVWIDPTHDQEKSGTSLSVSVQTSLEAVAQYLDGIAWSMYPPGRQQTQMDPTYNMPVPNNPTTASTQTQRDAREGWLERCFYRTQQTAISVGAAKKLPIAIWECGTGAGSDQSPPNDNDARPWWASHVLAQWCYERAKYYDRIEQMRVALWWDQEKSGIALSSRIADILSHEDQSAGGNASSSGGLTLSATKPHTSWAWVHWKELIPHYGGTRPTSYPSTSTALTNKGWKGVTGGVFGLNY